MNDHTPTVEETAQAVTEAKASPIFAAAYDAVFGHIRATNRAEALKAAYAAYEAAYAAYEAELARIDKEYPL
jgi:cytochrome c peroxidase